MPQSKHPNKFSSTHTQKKDNQGDTYHCLQLFCRGDICRHGVKRLVNRGSGYSWTYSPHLRLECTGLAFQTLSPVTRETPAALESTEPPPPPHPSRTPSTPSLARHHTRPWKSCLERKDEDFPGGRLQPLASRRPYCLLAPNWFEDCEIILIM